MSRETEVETILEADATLMVTLTGGVYATGALGEAGIGRDVTAAAFDADGYLKPCAVVRQRELVPDQQIYDPAAKHASAAQRLEIYVYQDSSYTNIDTAVARIYTLLQGTALAGSFPLEWAGTISRARDDGALQGRPMARIDFMVHDLQGD